MRRIGLVTGLLPLAMVALLAPAVADDTATSNNQNGTQPDQTQAQDQNTTQKKTEVHKTVTGPHGRTATKDTTVVRDGNTVQKDTTVTGPNGKTANQDVTWTKDGNTVTHEGTTTGPNGQTVTTTSTTTGAGTAKATPRRKGRPRPHPRP